MTEAFRDRKSTEIEREILHVNLNFGQSIDAHLRKLEVEHSAADCLMRHKITPVLRSRMVDWMVEVITNFRCDDQTFFVAVSIMDRYFQRVEQNLEVSALHVSGVAAMFLASKYEDIYPLKMRDVYEKIGHKRLTQQKIKSMELELLKVIDYKVQAPTILEFLKTYLKSVIGLDSNSK